jgi:ssDNA-binding Zn-finger/Zn-ribbon topoisomerase 1
MARSASSSIGEGIGAYVMCWWLIHGISVWLKTSWWLSAFYLISLAVFTFCIWKLVSRIKFSIETRKRRAVRCAHGVLESGATCEVCRVGRIAEEKHRKALQIDAERLAKIKTEAAHLRNEEQKRLGDVWRMRPDSYFDMGHRDFEDAICDVFRKLGYEATRTPFSKDGGKDGILNKDGRKLVLECKRYGAKGKTGRPELQILLAAMMDEQADGAIFVTTGSFTSDALEYARNKKMKLYDRKSLPFLINEAYGTPAELFAKTMCLSCGDIVVQQVLEKAIESTCSQGHNVVCSVTIGLLNGTLSPVRTCSLCSAPMKIIKYGNSDFLGCARYPACHHREHIRSRRGRTVRRFSRYRSS